MKINLMNLRKMNYSKKSRGRFQQYNNIVDEEEEEDDFFIDGDSCTPSELEQNFRQKFFIADETAISLKKEYILSLCCDRPFTRIAAGLSSGAVHIFSISDQRGLSRMTSPEGVQPTFASRKIRPNTCGVRFLDESANNLLIGNPNGVRLYDLRTNKQGTRFEENFDDKRSFTTFDRNANSRIICVGTDEVKNKVFLVFYDIRQRKRLGKYFCCHQNEITAVRFHDTNPDVLCTGSVDGLINVFNIAETSEEEALQTTINTESSVGKLNWHKNACGPEIISCITNTNDFKLYDCLGDSIADFERSNITEAMKRKLSANCSLVGCHNVAGGDIFLLAGTNLEKGKIMRSLLVKNKQLQPLANFEGNKQIIRESVFNSMSNALVTGGESGIVTIWRQAKLEDIPPTSDFKMLKIKAQSKVNKSAPY